MTAWDNPFASHRIEGLAFRFPAGETWETLLARLESRRWRGALVGPHGTGKTTLLEQLVPRLRARGFRPLLRVLRVDSSAAEKQALLATALRAPDFLLMDGAEQLSFRQWLALRRIIQPAAGCLLTLHRCGRLPTVLTMRPSPALLGELASELAGTPLPAPEAERLFCVHRGNVRECLRELYDRWAA